MKKEDLEIIKWNIINSLLAGGLVVLGSLTDGDITLKGLLAGLVAGGLVALNKFKDFWTKEGKKKYIYSVSLGSFI